MASGPQADAVDAAEREKRRWGDSSKVYVRRRKFKRSPPPPVVKNHIPYTDSIQQAPASPEPPQRQRRVDSSSGDVTGGSRVVGIGLDGRSKEEVRELEERLVMELSQVRAFMRWIEAREVGLAPTLVYTVEEDMTVGVNSEGVSGNDFAVSTGAIVNSQVITDRAVVNSPVNTDRADVNSPVNTDRAVVNSPVNTDRAVVNLPMNTDRAVVNSPVNTNQAVVDMSVNIDRAVVNSPMTTDHAVVNSSMNTDQAVVDTSVITDGAVVDSPLNADGAVVDLPVNAYQAVVDLPVNPDRANVNSPVNRALVSLPIDNDQAVNPPMDTDHAVLSAINTDQAVNSAMDTDQAVNPPKDTDQAVNPPKDTDQAVNSPMDTDQAVNSPMDTVHADNLPMDTDRAVVASPMYTDVANVPMAIDRAVHVHHDRVPVLSMDQTIVNSPIHAESVVQLPDQSIVKSDVYEERVVQSPNQAIVNLPVHAEKVVQSPDQAIVNSPVHAERVVVQSPAQAIVKSPVDAERVIKSPDQAIFNSPVHAEIVVLQSPDQAIDNSPVHEERAAVNSEPVTEYRAVRPLRITIPHKGSSHAPVTPVLPRPLSEYSEAASQHSVSTSQFYTSNHAPITPALPRQVMVNSEYGYATPVPTPRNSVSQFSQYPNNNDATFTPMPPRRFFATSDTGGHYAHPTPGRRLSVSVPDTSVEIFEKRTPKANQYYRNEDFILGSEKLPPSDSHKKSKSNGSRHGGHSVDKRYAPAFRSCMAVLTRLMKHNYAWVFNTPVDVKGLGLHDYFNIIKNPMDLGTVRMRLGKNWYKTPKEFAEDVRLTFRNAMTYNPKGQDVHFMAEQLQQIFEERWPGIEAEFAHLSYVPPPKKFQPVDMRTFERSDSTARQISLESRPRPVYHVSHATRPPALQKPKAKDLNKRNMTFEEKQKLSTNLGTLPGEKLDNVVQIIKKRNASLCEQDEIEVDIDSVDIETLWELDRFVTNYKKSLSKHKRRAELAAARAQGHNNMHVQERVPGYVLELIKEDTAVVDQKNVAPSVPVGGENNANAGSRSSSSSSSSSGSGSSSSDSDSDSSGYGSERGH